MDAPPETGGPTAQPLSPQAQRLIGQIGVRESLREVKFRIQGRVIGTPNQVEAVTAYFEKREPVFRDRA